MRVDIAWWDLDESPQTIETLCEDLRQDTIGCWAEVPGLRLKLWMADRANNRWGAVMLWEQDRPTDRPLPPNRAAELIGRPPDHRSRFDVEAAVEGLGSLPVGPGRGDPLVTGGSPPTSREDSRCTST